MLTLGLGPALRLLRGEHGLTLGLGLTGDLGQSLGLGTTDGLGLSGSLLRGTLGGLLGLALGLLELADALLFGGLKDAAANLFPGVGTRGGKVTILGAAHVGPCEERSDILRRSELFLLRVGLRHGHFASVSAMGSGLLLLQA